MEIKDKKNLISLCCISQELDFIGFLRSRSSSNGWDFLLYKNVSDFISRMPSEKFHIIVLDGHLENTHSIQENIQNLRNRTKIPIIVIVPENTDVSELVARGADACLFQPFTWKLFLAYVQSLSQRYHLDTPHKEEARWEKKFTPPDISTEAITVIERGPLILDRERFRCTWQEHPIKLTSTEFLLLWALAYRPGIVKNRRMLIEDAGLGRRDIDDRAIDSHIKRLRQKIKKSDSSFDAIQAFYGVGYLFKTPI
jgi:two-component system response regulator ChvI